MNDHKPEPLVSSDVDLRDFVFMPLDVLRLRDSDLSTVATGEEFKAAVLLWCAAWHQVPAASIPNDDRWLARHSGAGPRWGKVKVKALRGFVECADGRLYHEVVAEKALESWAKKQSQRERTRLATEARRKRHDESGGDRDVERDVERNVNRDDARDDKRHVDRNVVQGTVKGQLRDSEGKGQGRDRDLAGDVSPAPPQNPGAAASATPAAERPKRANGKAKPEPETAETWDAYSAAYLHRWRAAPVRNAKVNSMVAQFVERIGAQESPRVAAFYLGSNRGLYVSAKHPVNLLLRDAEALRTEWATGHHGTETQARQADQTAATGNVFANLIAEAEEREKLGSGEASA